MPSEQRDRSGVGTRAMANAVRALTIDAIEVAGSGHPGLPLGMADVATVLVRHHLRFDPSHPDWFDRDRLVLSAGHGSMLLYALLWLTGHEGVELDHLRRFRQLGSPAAGHPEYGHLPGVETTTGPLGQGLGNAVGMAIAEAHLRARYGPEVCNHRTYVIAGDGCLMEGIASEAISLAGHLGLGRLTVLFDDNRISIDGETSLAVSDDQRRRFEASGWHTQAVDGHDPEAISSAIAAAAQVTAPSMIACRTTIGFGSPNRAGTSAAHGSPLGPDEAAATRAQLGWDHPPFHIPGPVLDAWRATGNRGASLHGSWSGRVQNLDRPVRAEFRQRLTGGGLAGSLAGLRELKRRFAHEAPQLATRQSSGQAIEALTRHLPALIGGSADLSGSNGTLTDAHRPITADDHGGNYLHYGVREHAMAAAMNGMALHRGVRPYGGTFLAFSDYSRPAIRMAALMGLDVVHVMTHDSIGLGEDGPTHQPVEHLAALRAIPGLDVIRPADAVEVVEAWELAVASPGRPIVLCLSRQALPTLRRPTITDTSNLVARGGYTLTEPDRDPDVVLIGTGSEVALAAVAAEELAAEGVAARVVSMPCLELFVAQPGRWRQGVLGQAPRVVVEAAVASGWGGLLRPGDRFVGMTGFGASGPAPDLYEHFGITAGRLVDEALDLLPARSTT